MWARRELYGPDGNLLWDDRRGADAARSLAAHTSEPALLGELLGVERSRTITRGRILSTIEDLEFVTRDACAPGFVTVLPKGVVFDEAVEALNRADAASVGATRVDFPFVFAADADDVSELTSSFESQGLMFRLDERDRDLRLAYAADAGLLPWLRGKRLEQAKLPWIAYSPMPVFRRRQSGEINLGAMRQYPLPDLHALCVEPDALDVLRTLVTRAAETARFLFGESWGYFVELSPELAQRFPGLGAQLARAARQQTVVRYLERRVRYFELKGGITVHTGADVLMLFNFQWDETNSDRFRFRTDTDRAVVVIHSTLVGGWPKLLPAVVGRGLAGAGPRVIPVEFAPTQIVLLAVGAEDVPAAEAFASELRGAELRVAVDADVSKPVGRRVADLRREWNPFHAVVGRREAGGEPLELRTPVSGDRRGIAAFLDEFGERLRLCRPAGPQIPLGLPFAGPAQVEPRRLVRSDFS